MKCFIVVLLCMFILGNSTQLFSQNNSEYTKAHEYLNKKGEVYFRFNVASRSQISQLTNIISIDNVCGLEVYAYANKEGFQEFSENNLYYEVLPHPGDMLENPLMYDGKSGESFEFDKYPTYEKYEEIMDQFASDYPDLCVIEQFGTSVDKRKLLVAKVTDNVNEEEKEPKFFYQSTIHGDETASYIFMLNLIDYLLSGYGRDPRVTNLVENIEIWINPLANPDGTYQNNNSSVQGASRFNANGQDLNRDFPNVNLYGHKIYCDNNKLRVRAQPETNATLVLGDENIFTMSGDFHAGVELVCYIWGMSSTRHADEDWWEYVGEEWKDLAQKNGPSGYFDDQGGCVNAYDWYSVQGERMNHAAHKQQCRSLTIEVSTQKTLSESSLLNYWGYQKESTLAYLEQVLYGIQGTVTDTNTGEPLEAKVFVEDHDKDNSHVYSHLPHGDYYRPIIKGTYDLTFTCDGYIEKTITDVVVENKKATIRDVELWDGTTGIEASQKNSNIPISIIPYNRGVKISYTNIGGSVKVGVFNINGKLVGVLPVQTAPGAHSALWDGKDNNGQSISNGCYIVKLVTDRQTFTKSFIYSR